MRNDDRTMLEKLMLFPGRVNRAMKFQREQNGHDGEENLLDPKAEYEERPLSEKLEKGDITALILSGILVFVPIATVTLLAIVWIARLLFRV